MDELWIALEMISIAIYKIGFWLFGILFGFFGWSLIAVFIIICLLIYRAYNSSKEITPWSKLFIPLGLYFLVPSSPFFCLPYFFDMKFHPFFSCDGSVLILITFFITSIMIYRF
ncbi:hypothetical protein KAJ27_05905, partial [bacterium]|nr:hypothetical protein [bacterium]